MVDKIKAVNMRKMGMSYKDISIAAGCSESWCKQNLKDVRQEYSISDEQLAVKNQAIEILEEALAKLRSLG
jgi:hypothetical protein